MYIITGQRGEEKTSQLLACTNYEKGIAVVLNKTYAEHLAKSMHIDKIDLLSYNDFLKLYHHFGNDLSSGELQLFIDELPILLDILDIHIETNEIYNPSILPTLFKNKFPNIHLKGYSYTTEDE